MSVTQSPVAPSDVKTQLPLAFLGAVFWINLLAFLNFSSVFVAMNQIGSALDAPESMTLQLPTALYAAIACAAPATPYLLLRLGPRRLLLGAMIGLSATTVLASLCQTFWQLVVVLFLHGMFCAPISPATQAAVKERLSNHDLGIGMAIWGAGNYAGGLIGPLIAGTMITVFGWRSLFLIPLPFVLIALPLVIAVIAKTDTTRPRPDVASLVVAPLAMLLLVVSASLGPDLDWFASPLVLSTSILFALSVPLFFWSYRRTHDPRFHLGCLKNRDVALSLFILLAFNMVSTGLFQVEYLGKDPTMTAEIFGLRTSIGAGTLLLGFAASGWLCRGDHLKAALLIGIGTTLIAKFGFLLYNDHTTALQSIWPVAVGGIGFGLITGLLATTAYRTLDEKHAAHIATCFILATYLGASLGAGVLSEVLVAFDQLFIDEGMSAQDADRHGFKSEFWVEFGAVILLLIPGWMLVKGRAETPSEA